jgi:hypothetical protein
LEAEAFDAVCHGGYSEGECGGEPDIVLRQDPVKSHQPHYSAQAFGCLPGEPSPQAGSAMI